LKHFLDTSRLHHGCATYGYRGQNLYEARILCKIKIESKVRDELFVSSAFLDKAAESHEVYSWPSRRNANLQSSWTIVEATHIFQDVPVRRCSMKMAQELEKILKLVKAYGVSHPKVKIQYYDTKSQLSILPGLAPLDAISRLFPEAQWTSLDDQVPFVDGFAALNRIPGKCSIEIVSVNGLYLKRAPSLQSYLTCQKIMVPSSETDTTRKYHYILWINVDGKSIQVQNKMMRTFLQEILLLYPSLAFELDDLKLDSSVKKCMKPCLKSTTVADRSAQAYKRQWPSQIHDMKREESTHKKNLNETAKKLIATLNNLKIVGQVDKKFILCKQLESGRLILFDQHAIHERIRLERFQQEMIKSERAKRILIPLPNNLTIDEISSSSSSCSASSSLKLEKWHLKVQRIRHQLYATEAPRFIPDDYLKKYLPLILQEVKTSTDITVSCGSMPQSLLDLLKSLACHGAIKFNQTLTMTQMQNILADLTYCQFPFICAHGRTSIHII
jgi:DNA mismatch repair ATPase MutL